MSGLGKLEGKQVQTTKQSKKGEEMVGGACVVCWSMWREGANMRMKQQRWGMNRQDRSRGHQPGHKSAK
jgi:hypothetical protein